jgi:hypothetical protein
MEDLNNLFTGLITSMLFIVQQRGSSRRIYGVSNLKTFGRNVTVPSQVIYNNVISKNFRTYVFNSIQTKFCLYMPKLGGMAEKICVS